MVRIEVCTGSIEDSIIAWKAGASRIELNCSLETGGLSPSPGILAEVLSSVKLPVMAMVRPRSGNFLYSVPEKKAMMKDMELFLAAGAGGIVFGSLTGDLSIDVEFVTHVRKAVENREIVFNRAFDLTRDLKGSAMLLADLGVNRILTSGGRPTAFQGREVLRELVSFAGGSIEILPGSGINSTNAAELAGYTGCSWLHGSFSRPEEKSQGGFFPGGPVTSAVEIELIAASLSRD